MDMTPAPPNDTASGVFGSISLAASICLSIPQLIKNFRAGSADGLSLAFLAVWLLGDVVTLLGGIITGIAPSAVALSAYFCFSDCILITQTLFYKGKRRFARRAIPQSQDASQVVQEPLLADDSVRSSMPYGTVPHATEQEPQPLSSPAVTSINDSWIHNLIAVVSIWLVGILGYFLTHAFVLQPSAVADAAKSEFSPQINAIGEILGYIGALCYLCAPTLQILKNYKEKSTKGLAILFFLFSITSDLAYGMSILVYSQDRAYIVNAIPWLLGSFGVVIEDGVIFYQFSIYAHSA